MTEPLPYRAEVTSTAAAIIETHSELEAGTETDQIVSIAGRLMLRRDQGKLAFGVLQDSTGRIQLFAMARSTPDFDGFTGLSIGDWILVTGVVMNTKRGELSVRVDEWTVLAPTQRPFPDKWHGISDPDIRYRQRYVDLWVTEEARTAFRQRSAIVAAITLTMRRRPGLKRQDIGKQVATMAKDRVRVVSMKAEKEQAVKEGDGDTGEAAS